jgi:hypothetical protein
MKSTFSADVSKVGHHIESSTPVRNIVKNATFTLLNS